ncbi:uncharacterized protein FIBRA_08036 [Fibroporia radiculosa]|uniref:BTB domain-containing protein n=1 Tax=Fibroporia radiculosa TaxID=599839 RepID=J4I1Z4_9APHY|nr:uncharacterized protein FIBRA_08036 [Fibroporia radiculosa]CCM05802.1 predicted protein [Fibroporia radiculosa]
MYPISDLTAFCRKTTGDVPPQLVGASTTVVGSKMYLYGGCLAFERRMVSDIYTFDFETFVWERLNQHPEDDVPTARYFHSANIWRSYLIIFGGRSIKPQSEAIEALCVLNDIRMFDITTGHWLPSSITTSETSPLSFIPTARFAHLSSVSADRLYIIGGQDLALDLLDDLYIYDLAAKVWLQRREYSRHCSTYRSVAVTPDVHVHLPQEESSSTSSPTSDIGIAGTRFKVNGAAPTPSVTRPDSLVHLPYSKALTSDHPCDIFVFSNHNFTDVQREFQVISPLSDGDIAVSDRSNTMTGTSFPPGLRFPTGAVLGTYFIVAGTYISHTYQSFSIWALDLLDMSWIRIDRGSALATGSWFRSCLWSTQNKLLVFGDKNGNLVEDYDRRLLNWDYVTSIDLEAFGIYQPPSPIINIRSQELGLAALEEGVLADFEIICNDDRRIKCSRKLLEERWPWFKEQHRLFAQSVLAYLRVGPPDLFGVDDQRRQRPDPRLTPRSFCLSEPYPVALALVQYFYSTALITPLQRAPAVLSQLLLLSSIYDLTHLQSLVKQAMHQALSNATSAGIYSVATLCSCRSLQIRALRVVIASSQKRPAGARPQKDKDRTSTSQNHTNVQDDIAGRPRTYGNDGENLSSEAHTRVRSRGMSDTSDIRGSAEADDPSLWESTNELPRENTITAQAITREEQRILTLNASVVSALEDLFSWRFKDRTSRMSVLSPVESWRFRRALYRIWLISYVYGMEGHYLKRPTMPWFARTVSEDSDSEKWLNEQKEVLDTFLAAELRQIESVVKFLQIIADWAVTAHFKSSIDQDWDYLGGMMAADYGLLGGVLSQNHAESAMSRTLRQTDFNTLMDALFDSKSEKYAQWSKEDWICLDCYQEFISETMPIWWLKRKRSGKSLLYQTIMLDFNPFCVDGIPIMPDCRHGYYCRKQIGTAGLEHATMFNVGTPTLHY